MKHLVMTRPKHSSPMASTLQSQETEGASDAAFDLWLQRSLHQLFDTVAKEPIPQDLLRLIEEDRSK